MFFFPEVTTDTVKPILEPLMRLASTSLQGASQEVISTHNQFEVRLRFAFYDLIRRLTAMPPSRCSMTHMQ